MFTVLDDYAVIYRVKVKDGWTTYYGPYSDREEAEYFAERRGGVVEYTLIEWKGME